MSFSYHQAHISHQIIQKGQTISVFQNVVIPPSTVQISALGDPLRLLALGNKPLKATNFFIFTLEFQTNV